MTIDTSNLFIGVGAVNTPGMLRINITRLIYAADLTTATDNFTAYCESLGNVLFVDVTGVML
jgi:hypothetical protein